jgi:hypothetical protein
VGGGVHGKATEPAGVLSRYMGRAGGRSVSRLAAFFFWGGG